MKTWTVKLERNVTKTYKQYLEIEIEVDDDNTEEDAMNEAEYEASRSHRWSDDCDDEEFEDDDCDSWEAQEAVEVDPTL